MTTLWTMPESEIHAKREKLKRELEVHEEHTIVNLKAWTTMKEVYELLLSRYDDELKKRGDKPTN
jgi:hypothetical protein